MALLFTKEGIVIGRLLRDREIASSGKDSKFMDRKC
jgi:hypothetical protein